MSKQYKVTPEPEYEDEANLFALLLLMPKHHIQQDLKQKRDLLNDNNVEELCKKYQVSTFMLFKRIELLKNENI